MPRLAYWDQEDHDKAVNLIRQPRQLKLMLSFKTGKTPLSKKKIRVYVARSMVEGCDEYNDYLLDEKGQLELEQKYSESLIDVELGSQALPSESALETLTFHWFHPGKWFENLIINQDVSSWSIRQIEQGKGDLKFELTFDNSLKPSSAFVSFSNLLGQSFDGPEMGSTPEAAVAIPRTGSAHITFHLREFFTKWMSSYKTPYNAGDEYSLEISMTFNTSFKAKPSSQKDPPFVPITYDGRVDHTDGNPYIGVPSTTPESTIQVNAKMKIILTPDMLPG
jgi:hypothetical protein